MNWALLSLVGLGSSVLVVACSETVDVLSSEAGGATGAASSTGGASTTSSVTGSSSSAGSTTSSAGGGGDCPVTAPNMGEPCPVEGQSCFYPGCCPVSRTCQDGIWTGPLPEPPCVGLHCPVEMPSDGS